MWGRIKAFFSRDPKPGEPPAPPSEPKSGPAPEPGPSPEPGHTTSAPDSEVHIVVPPLDPNRDPLLNVTDARFLEARQLAHSFKLEATIAISNVQQRYKFARYAQTPDPAPGLIALREPITRVYSDKLGQDLLLLAFARSLRRKFHRIVADAAEAARDRSAPLDDLRNQVYHLTRAQDLATATKLCLEASRHARASGDGKMADELCAYQVELLQRQLNVRVPLDDAIAKAAVWQWMGFVYQAQGKAAEAGGAFSKADEINPPQDEYRDPVAEALGDWRTYELDEFPAEPGIAVVPPASPAPSDAPDPPAQKASREPALSGAGPIQRTASEMLHVDLPEPPDIFSEA